MLGDPSRNDNILVVPTAVYHTLMLGVVQRI
jgi:hypothetical protein